MSTRASSRPAFRPRTARAFLLAPGIAALAGGAASFFVMIGEPYTTIGQGLLMAPFLAVAFAVVGYTTAVVLAVPAYLLLPERARSAFALVVPLAGVIAAAPWVLCAAPWRDGRVDLPVAAIPFALGVVAGIAFLFIRRPPEAWRPGWRRGSP